MSPQDRLIVESECTRLINLYAALNDQGRWHELAALYTENGRMARPSSPEQVIEGRDAILQSFLLRPARVARHFCCNIIVDVDSKTSARAESRILLFAGNAQEGAELAKLAGPPLIGEYFDRFECTAAGWRFSERLGRLSMQS